MIENEIKVNQGAAWIRLHKLAPNRYEIIDDSIALKNGDWITQNTALGVRALERGADYINLDHDSDEFQCFGQSQCFSLGPITFSPAEISGGSLKEIKEALKRVEFFAYCGGDI